MKSTIKKMMMVVCSVVLFNTTACADKNKPIQVNELQEKKKKT